MSTRTLNWPTQATSSHQVGRVNPVSWRVCFRTSMVLPCLMVGFITVSQWSQFVLKQWSRALSDFHPKKIQKGVRRTEHKTGAGAKNVTDSVEYDTYDHLYSMRKRWQTVVSKCADQTCMDSVCNGNSERQKGGFLYMSPWTRIVLCPHMWIGIWMPLSRDGVLSR